MAKFILLMTKLLSMVPEGNENDVFAIFSGDPRAGIPDGMLDEDAWEQILDPMLNRIFQGVSDDELGALLRRGRMGRWLCRVCNILGQQRGGCL
jgi:hypothetical protein